MAIIDVSVLIRLLALALHVGRFLYWQMAAIHPTQPTAPISTRHLFLYWRRLPTAALGGLIAYQLLFNPTLWPFASNMFTQLLGLILVIIGIGVSVIGRYQLGKNWTHAAHYQVKPQQVLVTTGIYRYIRHPIYIGMCLAYIGAEIVAGSWLFLPIGTVVLFTNWRQARKEEVLLQKHFPTYRAYQKQSAFFIPGIW